MCENETRTVVARWFAALDAGDVETAMACLDDNVRWINSPGEDGRPGGVPGLSAIVPWFGDFASKAEVMATFGPYAERQETLGYERLDEMYKDDTAFVLLREVARIRDTGLAYDIEFVQRYRVADGRIVFLRAYLDTCRMVAAFRGDMRSRLLAAARTGDLLEAERILPFGADPNATDPESSESALMLAARAGHADMVKLLIAGGAEPNLIARKTGATALHGACRAGQAGSVEALIAGGALVDVRRPATGETPLQEAIHNGHRACAALLVAAGANDGHAGPRPAQQAQATLRNGVS